MSKSNMLELSADNALAYLKEHGLVQDEPCSIAALAWGVSNLVLRVETPRGLFIVKQSRPQLRTRDAWFSDLDRIYRELEVMQTLGGLLPAGVVPIVLFVDRPNYLFAMSHAPLPADVWKAALLAGQVDLTLGEKAGTVLGQMHEATANRLDLMERFRDATVFGQLRVDPFYRRIQERCPDVAHFVAPLVEELLTRREALCHGDYSPKNILTHPGGFTLVDYETAHLGDPTMDLGFFLSHILLKAVHRPELHPAFFELTRAFWRGYEQEARFRPLAELTSRGVQHLAVCLLARVDGTSPVDYLPEEPKRVLVRRLGRRILADAPLSWSEVVEISETELRMLGMN